ncbi:MAG: ABC transporter ATP-binding protein [Anaeroplasma sp.]|nr:ABC transporter ATP-binding protein [Anaeroplasma sp.]
MSEVIKVNEVTKSYNLYNKPIDRLKESMNFIRRKSYHVDFKALNSISFSVNKGECFGIIGTNGSGKSTILKIITGVLQPTTGSVEVNGRVSALLELGAGFNMDYTGIENIYMNGMVLGMSKSEVDEILPKIEEFAEIGDFINQPVKLYSSGMFARLAFAVAINVDPDILIVDEALSVGDIFFQAKCYKKFEEFKKLGKTILFVTHDMTSVLKYCDRVMLLNQGEFIKIGKPSEIVNIYKKILANSYNPNEEKNIENKIENNDDLWKNHLAVNPNPQIYGNGLAEIIDFGIFDSKGELTNTVEKFSNVLLKVKIKFNNHVENPIVAWTLKNNKGLEIMGTNTLYENVELSNIEAGDIIVCDFYFTVPIAVNQYLLDLGVTKYNGDELEVLCRNYEITTLDILSKTQNVGIVDPNCEIKVIKEN